jgi:hypothetical protein
MVPYHWGNNTAAALHRPRTSRRALWVNAKPPRHTPIYACQASARARPAHAVRSRGRCRRQEQDHPSQPHEFQGRASRHALRYGGHVHTTGPAAQCSGSSMCASVRYKPSSRIFINQTTRIAPGTPRLRSAGIWVLVAPQGISRWRGRCCSPTRSTPLEM